MTALDELGRALGSSDPEERRRAAAALAEHSGEAMVRLVLQALGDEDWRVRKEATAVAVQHAPSPELLTALVGTFGPSDNVGLRNAAVEALGAFGEAGVGALNSALSKLDADGRKLAAEALGRTDSTAALDALAHLLGDKDPNVRAAAVEAITAMGAMRLDDAVPLLSGCLSAEDRFQRLAAINGLNQLGVILSWQRIEPMLDDPMLERPALTAAARSGRPEAAPLLVRALGSARGQGWHLAELALYEFLRAQPEMFFAAREALKELPEPARQRLLDEALEPDSRSRGSALLVLSALGVPEAAGIAVDALTDDRVAPDAEQALYMLGVHAVAELVERSRRGEPELRAECIHLLGQLPHATGSPSANQALGEALSDPSPEVVRAALGAVARIGDAAALNKVAELLSSAESAATQKVAAGALSSLTQRYPDAAAELSEKAQADGPGAHAVAVIIGALGPGPNRDRHVDFLSECLSSSTAAVRRAALEALAELASDRGLTAVAFALTDEEPEVQLAAIRALGRLRAADGSAPGVEHLLDLVHSTENPALSAAAVRALGDAGDARALPILRSLARTGAAMEAVSAVEALANFSDPRRVDTLIEALSHQEAEVVKAALSVLSAEPDPRVGAHLSACLDHEAWDVRRLSADLLGKLGGENALRLLRARLSNESEPLVRQALQRAVVEVETREAPNIRITTPPPSKRGSGHHL